MAPKRVKRGKRVSWTAAGGRVRDSITRIVTSPVTFEAYTIHASRPELQYEITSDAIGHIATRNGSARTKLRT